MKSESASVPSSVLPPLEAPDKGRFSLQDISRRSDIAQAEIGQPQIPSWQIQDYLAGLVEMGVLTWDWQARCYHG